jgi:hypothetical protein
VESARSSQLVRLELLHLLLWDERDLRSFVEYWEK